MTQLELPLDDTERDSSPVSTTLNERGLRYGNFQTQATLSQTLSTIWKQHYYQTHQNQQLPPFILEAVTMIFHKLARSANGDPLFADSYRDVAGFAQLIVENLQQFPGASDSVVTTAPIVTKDEIALSYS